MALKAPSKITSRKLWVFILWTVFAGLSLFIPDAPRETIFTFYGFVSVVYIGGNVASKYIPQKKE